MRQEKLVNSTSFERWFDVSKNWNDTCCLPEEQAREFVKLFDNLMLSPNGLYYDDITQKVYPIGSKSRLFSSIDEIKEKIQPYKEKYNKLFLYSIQLLFRTDSTGIDSKTYQFYKVRFAVFPEETVWHTPEYGMSLQ
jgi:hypothetical protein